ncbi:histidine kinase [Agaricicola taiwanensis]|uniref:histidine kinase n=1 Tax=Agaricicola taiwanensis TaxID=591372 RepID=A0A8J3E089_9RHOB|nr:HAMP domain-containing sensor histidine kinase [Agaricicola taiwanensis]GGE53693.1 histidine kinase [Agaricicola taiwanensis]
MKVLSRSIRLRLLIFATLGTLLAIGLAGAGLIDLFGRHVERRLGQELDTHIAQLAGALRIDAAGAPTLAREPSDSRFQRPLSGLYWQITDVTGGKMLRSRSLWDGTLPAPTATAAPGVIASYRGATPEGAEALIHARTVVLAGPGGERSFRIAAAIDRAELAALREGFARDLIPGILLLAALILIAAWVQVGLGLKPLARVREALAAVRAGREKHLAVEVPSEIAPLVAEVNTLLEAQEAEMIRARDRAADLAHGLRTPLTALASDVARLRAKGEQEIAADIEAVAVQMRRTVERELARARLRHQPDPLVTVPLASAVDAVSRTLARTPRGEHIAIEMSVAPDMVWPMRAEDLAEILGNLMENALRAARTRVQVSAEREARGMTLRIEDDGPGVDDARLAALAGRGRRFDETGSAGLGLAIVSDIAGAYGAQLCFDRSSLGGLKVELTVASGG